jgi:DNA replication protein DnaC
MDYTIKGIPEEYCNFTKESFYSLAKNESYNKYKECDLAIEKWLNSDPFPFGLLLLGVPGSGKTFWGTYVVINLLKRRITARRLVLEDIFQDYYSEKSSWSIPDIVYSDKVLFVDDFGKLENSEKKQIHVDKIMSALLKRRREKGLFTILAAQTLHNNISQETTDMLKDYLYPIYLPDLNIKKLAMAKKMADF